MKYVDLLGTKVSQISLGTVNYGTAVSYEESCKQMDYYLSIGGNFIDTARIYAIWEEDGDGSSERAIGRWMKERNNRDKVIISTKGAHPGMQTLHISRLSRAEIESDLNESLGFLQTDYIDLYFLHRDDTNIPVGEIMDILHDQVVAGKVKYLGASNWTAERVIEANKYAIENGKTPFVVSQIQWALATQNEDFECDDTCVEMNQKEYDIYSQNNVAVMAYTSQSRGFFSKYNPDIEGFGINDHVTKRYLSDLNIGRYYRAKEIAEKKNAVMGAMAIAPIINDNKILSIPVISAGVLSQLKEGLMGCDVELTKEELDYIWNGKK